MMIPRYVKGIAFVALMLSLTFFIVAALNVNSFSPTDQIVNDTTATVSLTTFVINVTESANFTWYMNGSIVKQTELMTTNAFYNNASAPIGYWNVTVDANSSNGTTNHTWWWNVTPYIAPPSLPSITNFYPKSNTSYVNTSIEFNITLDQAAITNWTIDYVFVYSTNVSNLFSSYVNSTAGVGIYRVEANATNANGSVSRIWTWNVTNAPDNTPPRSITNLSLENNGTSWIKWNWTKPNDTDFAGVKVYLDGGFKNTTTDLFYNATGLSTGTSHTISTLTIDTSNNVNATWVNLTNFTSPNTPTGQVTLTLSNLTISFSNVTASGNTMVTTSSSPPAPHNSLFSLISGSSYYQITSDATFNGNVTITLSYGTLPSGYSASDVRMYHYNTSWENVTTGFAGQTVSGNITGFSWIGLGVPPKPVFSSPSPAPTFETIGRGTQNFSIMVDQATNITWSIDSGTPTSPVPVLANTSTYFNYTPPTTKNYNVSVTARNVSTGVSNTTYWNWTVRSKTYETGNRIWDATKDMKLTYTWTPMSFYAFYYDVDGDVGNESLKVTLKSNTDRTLPVGSLQYATGVANVSLKLKGWGSYNVIGFMAEKYFAGYNTGSTTIVSNPMTTISQNQLHKVLVDDDFDGRQRAIYAGSTMSLSEGYVLKIKDVDITGAKIVLISLLKDGTEVDTTAVNAGNTYVYSKRKVGSVSDLPIIAVSIGTVFSGREANAVFIKGIFQISESYTSVNTGNRYGNMEITAVGNSGITMENKNAISLSSGSMSDVMGDIKIIVAENTSVLRFAPMVKRSGTYQIRGTISPDSDKDFEWSPVNFEGFYYDINQDIGSEKLSLVRSGRTVSKDNLVYSTSPQSVKFKDETFGSYNVIGFMAEKYFAGYNSGTSTDITKNAISTISSNQLHKVLTDDKSDGSGRAVYAGSTLTLSDGYVLKIKDVDVSGGKVSLISLLKDGGEVDVTAVPANSIYTYKKKVGTVSDLPMIIVSVGTVFTGREANAVFIKGIFQLSETITSVRTGDRFGSMEISTVSNQYINMTNPSALTLQQAGDITVMGNLKFKIADSNDVRFYPYIMVNGAEMAISQLSLEVPSNPMVKDTITFNVTKGGGTTVEGADVSFDGTSIGTTNSTGRLSYTLTKSGLHNVTATKLGFEKATKSIDVLAYVDNRLSIEVPAIIDQDTPVSIKVLSNGTAVPGADVAFDGAPIGTTDINGILSHTFTVSGTHNLGASKTKYITVLREISIRMPFSEFKAFDLNVSPVMIFLEQEVSVRAKITNSGTKADTRAIELVINDTTVENRQVTLAPGETKEVNFTRKGNRLTSTDKDNIAGNYTVDIMGQKGMIEVQKQPVSTTSYLLIAGLVTVVGLIAIIFGTSKGKLGLAALKGKLSGIGKK